MPRSAHQLLALLLDMARGDGSLVMSQACLANMMGVSVRTVQRAFGWLFAQGFAVTRRRRRRSSVIQLQLAILELAARRGFSYVRARVAAGMQAFRDAMGRFDATKLAATIHQEGKEALEGWRTGGLSPQLASLLARQERKRVYG